MIAPDYRSLRMEGGGERWLRRNLKARVNQLSGLCVVRPQDSADQGLEVLLGASFTLGGRPLAALFIRSKRHALAHIII